MKFRDAYRPILRKIYLLLLLLNYNMLYGQTFVNNNVQVTIPQIALLDIEPAGNNNITLTFSTPSEAGSPLTISTDNTTWLNYTSCVSATANSRKVSVQITMGLFPAGVQLTLQPGSPLGTGICGSVIPSVTITGTNTDFITGIRGCFTGDGVTHGVQLNYSINYTNFSDLRSGSYGPVQITYTLTNN